MRRRFFFLAPLLAACSPAEPPLLIDENEAPANLVGEPVPAEAENDRRQPDRG